MGPPPTTDLGKKFVPPRMIIEKTIHVDSLPPEKRFLHINITPPVRTVKKVVVSCKSTLGPLHDSVTSVSKFPTVDNHQLTKNYVNEKGEIVWEFALPSTPVPSPCSPSFDSSSSQGSHPHLLEVPVVVSSPTAEINDTPWAEVSWLTPWSKTTLLGVSGGPDGLHDYKYSQVWQ